MRAVLLFCVGAISFSAQVLSQAPPGDASLEEILVTGEYPGPGMWKVTRAEDPAQHVLWIVGDPPPLPKRMKWKSAAVESVARSAQEILLDAAVTMAPDEKVGFFRGLGLIPSALKARKNPDGAKLVEVLPADVYALWRVQKQLYLGSDSAVESWRPIFAADKLRKAAFNKLDLRDRGMVWEVVGDIARQNKIPTTTPTRKFTFKADELKSKIKEFSRESLSDADCMKATLALTRAIADRNAEHARARAWATADLETLAALPELPNPGLPCIMAMMGSTVARELIPSDIREQMTFLWLEAAMHSLSNNSTTLAIVPLRKLTDAEGYASALRARGLLVQAPQ